MTQKDKELLLCDLCARLPYGVFVKYDYGDGVKRVTKFHGNYLYLMILGKLQWKDFKPYLRPMYSMTNDERAERISILWELEGHINEDVTYIYQDWLNKHHFDYRGLIPKGLALEAPEKLYVDTDDRLYDFTEKCKDNDPTYVRKDAFIERAINFLNYKLDDVVTTRVPGTIIPHHVAKQELIDDFKKYMEE